MKTLSMKKLSLAVLTAACVLGVGVAEAIPKVSVKISVPKGSAGDEKAVTAMYKGMPWLPCTSTTASLGGVAIAATIPLDKLQFDLDVTNADDDKDTAKAFDYDLYVFFINYSAMGTVGTGNKVYALVGATGLTPQTLVTYASTTLMAAATPTSYRFMDSASFTEAGFKSTLFGSSISLDGVALDQGLWSVMAVMVRPSATAGVGGTLPAPALVAGHVDPGVVAGGVALQDPRNWAAWSMQPFVLGTPFKTATGMGNGVAAGTGVCL